MEKNLSLIVDIGNSQISAGIFDGLKLLGRIDTSAEESASYRFGIALIDYLEKNKISKDSIKNGYICSVVPSLSRWVQIVVNQATGINALIAGDELQHFIKKDIKITETIGGDLIADIVGATELYGKPCIITDLGTVTKTIVVDKNGTFLGAKFYPGLKSSFESMGEKAALLPNFDELNLNSSDVPDFQYGTNTRDCMRAGIYWGTIAGIIYSNKTICEELGKNVPHIITGGYSNFITKGLIKEGMIEDPDLVLKGLAIVFNKLKESL